MAEPRVIEVKIYATGSDASIKQARHIAGRVDTLKEEIIENYRRLKENEQRRLKYLSPNQEISSSDFLCKESVQERLFMDATGQALYSKELNPDLAPNSVLEILSAARELGISPKIYKTFRAAFSGQVILKDDESQ